MADQTSSGRLLGMVGVVMAEQIPHHNRRRETTS
jgi:hypothetical protein